VYTKEISIPYLLNTDVQGYRSMAKPITTHPVELLKHPLVDKRDEEIAYPQVVEGADEDVGQWLRTHIRWS
jgi:hypothetical protein